MSQPKRENLDGTYTPIPTMNRAEWAELKALPISDWARKLFSHQITVNSQSRPVLRGTEKREAARVNRVKVVAK